MLRDGREPLVTLEQAAMRPENNLEACDAFHAEHAANRTTVGESALSISAIEYGTHSYRLPI